MTTSFKYRPIFSVNANAKLIIQCSSQTPPHTLKNHTEIPNNLTRKNEKLATRIVQLAKYELNWTCKLKIATRTFQLATRTRTRSSNSQLTTRRIPRPCTVHPGLDSAQNALKYTAEVNNIVDHVQRHIIITFKTAPGKECSGLLLCWFVSNLQARKSSRIVYFYMLNIGLHVCINCVSIPMIHMASLSRRDEVTVKVQ